MDVVRAAASNWKRGKDIMALLLEKRGHDVQITEGVVLTAASNEHGGKNMMALLLEKREDVPIMELSWSGTLPIQ